MIQRRAGHQRFQPAVGVAEPRLQPHHRLAVGGEAEVAGLDDPRVHRPHRDLVQALALRAQEGVGRAALWPAERPAAMVEPGPGVRRPFGFQSGQVADGALQADRGRVVKSNRGEMPLRAAQAEDGGCGRRRVQQRHVDLVRLAPEAHQAPALVGQARDGCAPGPAVHDGAGPGRAGLHETAPGDQFGEGGHGAALIPGAGRHAGTRRPARGAGRRRRQRPAPGG